jgi:hypothetical protein
VARRLWFHRAVPEPSIPAGGFDPFEQFLVAGSEHLRHGRLPDARRAFLAAIEAQPGHPKALALLGLTYFRGGQYAEARPIYEELVAALPHDASHHLNLGLVYLKVGDADRAIGELEKSRALDPSQGRAVSYLGLAYARAGRFVEAYGAFLRAGQVDLAREIEQQLTDEQKQAIESAQRAVEAQQPTTVSGRFVMPTAMPRAVTVEPVSAPVTAPVAVAAPVAAPVAVTVAAPVAVAIAAPVAVAIAAPVAVPIAAPAEVEAAPVATDDDELSFSGDDDLDEPVFTSEAAAPRTTPRAEAPIEVRAPRPLAVPTPSPGHTAISRAVAQAAPSSAVAGSGTRVAAGSRPPQPLSELATARLVRPEDGDYPFEVSSTGVLVVRVDGKMFTRTEGVDVTGGELAYEAAHRRARGRDTTEPFAINGRALYAVSGKGHLIASPLGGQFTAVQLDDDIFYLREDLVFAFEPHLRWENGHVPGSRARLLMVQFRGSGAVTFRTQRPLLAVKLAPERVLYVDAMALAGWIGRVVPRGVQAGGTTGSELFVECTGEGVVLVEEETAPPVSAPAPAP